MLDSLHRSQLSRAGLARLGDYIVVGYYEFNSQDHVIMVLSADGQIVHEFAVDLWNAEYLFTAGQTINLIAYASTGFPFGETFTVHSYSQTGVSLGVDTAHVVPLPDGFSPSGHAYHYADGVLTIASALVVSGSDPLSYFVYLGRWSPAGRSAAPVWHPATIPPWSYAQGWTLTRGPDGSDLLGFFVAADLEPQVRIAAFDSQGYPLSPGERIYSVSDLFSLSGLDLTVSGGIVYPVFAAQARSSEETSGIFIAGFPFVDFLGSRERPHIAPEQLSLTAYPNPFNAAVRIDFAAPVPHNTNLQIIDVLGRRVADLPANAGARSVRWTADGLPSGMYTVRLKSSQSNAAARVILLR